MKGGEVRVRKIQILWQICLVAVVVILVFGLCGNTFCQEKKPPNANGNENKEFLEDEDFGLLIDEEIDSMLELLESNDLDN